MRFITSRFAVSAILLGGLTVGATAGNIRPNSFDLRNHRYQIDSPSVFKDGHARQVSKLNTLISNKDAVRKAAAVENPDPLYSFTGANEIGDIDAPNGQLWHYTGEFVYEEIPPHDNVAFTDRILREYTFTIYDADMKKIGVIKDEMNYIGTESRTVLCEITPVATRNFFNTDDTYELMVALGVNRGGNEYGNNYRTLVYALDGKTDANGYNKPIDTMDDLVADVAEGPEIDGKDNFYITFLSDLMDDVPEDAGFWDYMLAQKVDINIYGRAIDDKGPRNIYSQSLPMVEYPGDQQDVAPFMSMRRGDDVIYCFSKYAEPFYNRYDDPLSDDMTQREGNSLLVNLYKASETGLDMFSTTSIPVVLDPMKDDAGNPTALFSFYSVGTLRYTGDILFDAPGATADKPDFIVTRTNYQISTDDMVNSYFTYNNDGTLKSTLFEYADGTVAMGDLDGFEPQQMFVSEDYYGYIYNFVDIYSGKKVTTVDANYFYDNDKPEELLSANVARTPLGDSYVYVFELRYPSSDANGNTLMRFMYVNNDGTFNHIEYLNMGQNVNYAQSYLSTEALASHAYTTSDTPAFMCLVKYNVAEGNGEELLVAEAITEQNPDGKILLEVGANEKGDLASIVPEFAWQGEPGRLLVYYYNDADRTYSLDIYALPIGDPSGVTEIEGGDAPELTVDGANLVANGEIKVYALDGKLMASGIDSVEFASLDSGVYVVVANGKSYKIAK